MIQSLATRHRQQVEAGDTKPAATFKAVLGNDDRLMMAALQADKVRLKRLRSRQKKALLKVELLDKYRDYLTNIINRDQSGHNEVLVVICIWSIDAGDYKTAQTLADYALSKNMNAPEGFNRTLAEVIAEDVSDKAQKIKNPGELRGFLLQIISRIEDADIFDEVSAKLYKSLGFAWLAEDKTLSLQAFVKAQEYGALVKRKIAQLTKEVEKI